MINPEFMDKVFSQLAYSPDRGRFIWLKTLGRGVKGRSESGKFAERIHSEGYLRVNIDSQWFYAHDLAFLFMTRDWAKYGVDHINRDRSDNRWSNLRDVDRSQNMYNASIQVNNTSGYKGVSWDKGTQKWRAYIKYRGKRIYLGVFADIDAAIAARTKAEERFID